MKCSEAREILISNKHKPFFCKELHSAAIRHLTQCSKCHDYIESDKSLEYLIRATLLVPPLPPHIRENVISAIALNKQDFQLPARKNDWRLVIPGYFSKYSAISKTYFAALFLVLTVGYFLLQSRSPWPKVFIDDHIEYLPKENPQQISSTSAEEIGSWFKSKKLFDVKPPVFKNASLSGGRLCYLRGEKSALLFYEMFGHRLSLFILNDEKERFKGSDFIVSNGRKYFVDSRSGMNLVSWSEGGISLAAVSDIDTSILLESLHVY